MHEVLVNRLGGLSLPRKRVGRLTDRPAMTLDVYRGRKTTMQQQQQSFSPHFLSKISPQPFKIETSNLVYWFITTGNNVGLKMDILLFVVPCIFLFSTFFVQDTSHMLWKH